MVKNHENFLTNIVSMFQRIYRTKYENLIVLSTFIARRLGQGHDFSSLSCRRSRGQSERAVSLFPAARTSLNRAAGFSSNVRHATQPTQRTQKVRKNAATDKTQG